MSLSLNNISKYILGLLLLNVVFKGASQEVSVKDDVFRQRLCNKFELAMNEDCSLLDTVKAVSEYPSPLQIKWSNTGINSADEILYFKNLDSLWLNFNNLTSFPVDISRFRSLARLNIANNEIKIAPIIKYRNPISGDTAVKLVYLNNNEIDSLPQKWFEPNGLTQVIDFYDNRLDTIPDFATYNELRRLDLRNNYLKFDELIPIKAHPRWNTSEFNLFPQKEFFVYDRIVVEPGETIELDFNTGNPGDSYILLKNNSNHMTSADGKFVIENISDEDTAATYWVKIRNVAAFPDQSDFLKTTEFKIAFKDHKAYVDESETEKPGLYTLSPDGDGLGDFLELKGDGEAVFYNKSGQKILTRNLPFDWDGKDQTGNTVTPGLYIIRKGDSEYIKVLVSY